MAGAAFLRAIWRTRAFHPAPFRAALFLAVDVARHGPSLYALARWQAHIRPDAPAITSGPHTLTYRTLTVQADTLAARLQGLQGNAAVGVLDGNPLLTLLALLACGRLGWRAVPLSPRLGPEAVRDIQRQERLNVLLCPDTFAPTYPEAVALSVPFLPEKRIAPRRRASLSQLALLTSGSTGQPRLNRHRLRGLSTLPALTALLERLPLRSGMVGVLPLPLSHGHGLTFLGVGLFLGARLRLLNAPSAAQLWDALHEPSVEIVTLVPTQLHRLMAAPSPCPPGLRGVLCGSGPLDPVLARRALAHLGPVLFNLYGATETGPLTLATPVDLSAAPDSVGRILPGVPLQIQDGVVYLTGRGEPYRTGDVGELDDEGRLRLRGRADHLIITGGEKLHPEQLETRFRGWPYVQDCAVQGVPDAEYGQVVQAYLVLDSAADLDRFHADCEKHLPRAHRPRHVHLVSALPRTDAGKLLRRELNSLLPEDAAAHSSA